jgi:putative colanic acid biosynthesis acetyltransferase WcaF
LRRFGANIAPNVHLHPTVRIAIPWNLSIGEFSAVGDRVILYNLGRVTIGSRCTVSQGAHLCAGTHDHRKKDFRLVKAPIIFGDDVWVCADAFIGPGVSLGDMSIVAARGVVMRDIGAREIVAGNPARRVGTRGDPT